VLQYNLSELSALNFPNATRHEIRLDLVGKHTDLIVADARVSTRSIDPVDQLLLHEILKRPVPLFNLQAQIDCLKRRKPAHALRALAPTPNRIDLHRQTRVGHLRILVAAKRASHDAIYLVLTGTEIFVNYFITKRSQ
jgi:hypothetical protein